MLNKLLTTAIPERPGAQSLPAGRFGALLALLLLLTATGCGRRENSREAVGESAPPHLSVVTTLFPLYDWCRQLGGAEANVSLLLPPGQEAHSFEPTPGDLLSISRADLFVYVGDFMEPWAEDFVQGASNPKLRVVAAGREVELLAADEGEADHDGHDHAGHDHHSRHGVDPHVWLDPVRAQQMVRTLAAAFAEADPARADIYRQRGETYANELAALDGRFRAMLPACRHRTIVYGGHFTFGYFAKRYGLSYVSPYRGFSPDAEPTPRDIADMVETIRKLGARYVFHEELLQPRVASVISREAGVELLLLHGAHNVSRDELDHGLTYLQIMNANYERLKKGLECP